MLRSPTPSYLPTLIKSFPFLPCSLPYFPFPPPSSLPLPPPFRPLSFTALTSLKLHPRPLLLSETFRAPFAAAAARSMSGPPVDAQVEELVKNKNSQNPLVVYSKSWCPYCGMVKGLFGKLGVQPLVVELDELVDEQEVERALQTLTGQSTVPNVFIGGKHIGGCDDTMALHQEGELIPLLKEAGVKFT